MLATACTWHGAMIRSRAAAGSGNHLPSSGISMKEQNAEHLLDDIGWKILSELQQNARMPFAELGRIVGLSTPAVTERVHKMEEAGIIVGYRAQIDPAKVGLPIVAFVNVKVGGE